MQNLSSTTVMLQPFLFCRPEYGLAEKSLPADSAFVAVSSLAWELAPATAHLRLHRAAIDVHSEDLLVQPPASELDFLQRRLFRPALQRPFRNQSGNLAGLRAEWVFHARNSSRLEVTPLVVNGMMFVTAANDAFALDARTGRVVWHHAWPISEGLIDDASQPHQPRSWSLARSRLHGDRQCSSPLPGCALGQSDLGRRLCRLEQELRRNQRSAGSERQSSWWEPPAVMTACGVLLPPTMRLTGKLAWRFWTIPGPGEFGSESWPGKLYLHGGGTTWMPGTYDPATQHNLLGNEQSCAGLRGRRASRATISTPIACWRWIPTLEN